MKDEGEAEEKKKHDRQILQETGYEGETVYNPGKIQKNSVNGYFLDEAHTLPFFLVIFTARFQNRFFLNTLKCAEIFIYPLFSTVANFCKV